MAKSLDGELKRAIPPWALATCAIFFALAMTFRIIGIDVSGPLNVWAGAAAEAYKVNSLREAERPHDTEDVEARLKELEDDSHKPTHKK